MHNTIPCKVILILIIQLCSLLIFGQQKSYIVAYDGYHYAAHNEYKAIDTRTTVLISGLKSYSYDSSLPIKRPLGDTLNVYGKMTKARQVFKNRESKELVFTGSNYLLERKIYPIADTLFGFNWVYTSQTKKIESFPCKKAICIWRGRAYAAWYTEEIPIAEGPWKFGGLPGLIVELYDEEKDFYWKLVEFKNQTLEPIQIPKPEKNYQEVVSSFRKEARKQLAAANAQFKEIDPSCKNCNSSVLFQFPSIENWAD